VARLLTVNRRAARRTDGSPPATRGCASRNARAVPTGIPHQQHLRGKYLMRSHIGVQSGACHRPARQVRLDHDLAVDWSQPGQSHLLLRNSASTGCSSGSLSTSSERSGLLRGTLTGLPCVCINSSSISSILLEAGGLASATRAALTTREVGAGLQVESARPGGHRRRRRRAVAESNP
jgi:hypothetical protein